MKKAGYVVGYRYSHEREMRFDGPHLDIVVARNHQDELKSLTPAVQDVKIYQLSEID
jgi:hypothetical protein